MNALVVRFVLALVRLFYPDRRVRGEAPREGAAVVVANHMNGLVDPVLLSAVLGRPLPFLAKSTLFQMPVIGWFVRIFRGIPVYRAGEADPSKNAETFAAARQILAEGGWMALFPEGVSHSNPSLMPLKTGAARIVLGGPPGVRIVPVGLTYEDKTVFRSAVSVSIGPPLEVDRFRRHGGEHADDVAALTEAIGAALHQELLEAEDHEIWRGFRAVASWMAAPREPAEQTEARALALSRGWRALPQARREALERAARGFAARLASVGVRDPWLLDAGPPSAGQVLRAALPLVLTAPVALLGALLGWIPYRAVGVVVARLKPEEDLIATSKVLGGMLFLSVWWVAQAVALGLLYNPWLGLAALLIAPAAGLVALRWDERLSRRRRLGRAWWLLWTARGVADAVRRERAALADQVRAALGAVEA